MLIVVCTLTMLSVVRICTTVLDTMCYVFFAINNYQFISVQLFYIHLCFVIIGDGRFI